MKFIQGQNRSQIHLFPVSLDDAITPEHEIRFIDAFVSSLNLEEFGFDCQRGENGRPGYHPSDLLKLYIYGYLNRIRSSRLLEKECMRNIEVMWLLRQLKPDHNTISNFRRDNPKAIKKVFRKTVKVAQYFELIGGRLLAGDSTKLRAQNSKKNNFNQKKIDRHLEYIENKLQEYSAALAENDGDIEHEQQIKESIQKQQERKEGYQCIQQNMEESGATQVSTSDPDSRHLITRNNITEVAYNVQTTVDAKNNLPIDYKVTNVNDSKAMGNMLQRAKSILQTNNFTALYDKGYHTGSEFSTAHLLGIKTIVAIPTVAAQAPNPHYNVEQFTYNKKEDCYICPEQQMLTTTGRWHKAKTYLFKRYTTKACLSCKVKEQCSKATYGKGIQRSEYQELIEKNKQRVDQNQTYYKRRQAIVEHPYGTIKRQWGYSYIITKKSINRASADVGLIMLAYNLRRLINLVGLQELLRYAIAINTLFQSSLRQLKPLNLQVKNYQFLQLILNRITCNYNDSIIFNSNYGSAISF